MKKKGRKTLTVYPSPRVLAVLGTGAPTLNQALECWAITIARATAENASLLSRPEWNYLADCGNGTIWDPGFQEPGRLLAAQVEDAARLDGLGEKWLERPSDVTALAEKLAGLSYSEAWGVIVAVEFFWENCDRIALSKDEWWTTTFRANIAALDQTAESAITPETATADHEAS